MNWITISGVLVGLTIDWEWERLRVLVKVGGDADDADKAVTAVPSADVNPSEDVGGSDKNVKDVEKPKGDESRLKGDDFFDGLSQLEIDDDQVVLAGLEAVGKIHVPAANPDVVGEKSDALHTDEETEDTVSDTPLLDKRKRAPALKSPFVDFGSTDVGSTPMELMSSGSQSAGDDRDFKMVTYVKGLYALNDAFADPVSTEIEAKFDAWIAFTTWHRYNQLLMSWLYASLSDSMLGQIVGFTTATEIWVSLERTYSATSFARSFDFRMALQNLKKDRLNASAYLQKLKTLCNTLASVGDPISSQEHLTYLLNGLGLEYNAFVTPILARPVKPTIEEVHALLLSYEARLERQNAAASPSSLQANFANLSFPKQRPKSSSQQPSSQPRFPSHPQQNCPPTIPSFHQPRNHYPSPPRSLTPWLPSGPPRPPSRPPKCQICFKT
ncbi:hypothetical protein G4B88_029475 [Cannabis sativa]|uniref:Retrotransposon gag domain-containing protein n=1 Tax=Cannabis sativa TaxID=3483 RepID=A0A7J6FHQ6_CANSA|nr:hypothetical protein G4B88_029475 [Cannabis sativa]